MSYIFHHADTVLVHEIARGMKTVPVSLHAELGGDVCSTKATGGFWLNVESGDGKRRWPLAKACKKAGLTRTATADSETWSAVCGNEEGLKKEVIPLLQKLEVPLGRLVLQQSMEDNTQCIAATPRGYSPALRHLNITLGWDSLMTCFAQIVRIQLRYTGLHRFSAKLPTN
jgi:hypothetical protein